MGQPIKSGRAYVFSPPTSLLDMPRPGTVVMVKQCYPRLGIAWVEDPSKAVHGVKLTHLRTLTPSERRQLARREG